MNVLKGSTIKEEIIMPKIKTNRAAAKRFKKTGTGKLKRNKAYKSHILTKKSTKRKRNLRQATITDATNVKNMKKVLPYLAKKKHNRTLKLAKGYRGARSKQYRVAKQSVMRALTSAYAGRKQRKRQMRQLWIARINAAARMNGLSYSKFMHGLKLANVDMNRKMLAELAVSDKEGFATLAALAKEKIA